jgi:hypothetical protein
LRQPSAFTARSAKLRRTASSGGIWLSSQPGSTRSARSYTRWKLWRRAIISAPEVNSTSSERFSGFHSHQPPALPSRALEVR